MILRILAILLSLVFIGNTSVAEAKFKAQVSKKEAATDKTKPFSLKDAIQPRKEGAVWVYKGFYSDDGKLVSAGSSKEEIIKIQEVDGVTCYQVKLTLDWRSLMDRMSGVKLTDEDYVYFWEYFNEKGSYHLDSDKDVKPGKLSDFGLTLPYPVKAGAKYVVDDTHYEVVDVAKKVNVPAGEFTCVVYQMTYPEETEDDFKGRDRLMMAKGIGLVIAEGDVWKDGKWVLDYRDELSSYSLNLDEEMKTIEGAKSAAKIGTDKAMPKKTAMEGTTPAEGKK